MILSIIIGSLTATFADPFCNLILKLKEDKKVAKNKVKNTKTKLMVVKMNADAYDRINNTDKHYEAMQTPNYPVEERTYYKVDDKIRTIK